MASLAIDQSRASRSRLPIAVPHLRGRHCGRISSTAGIWRWSFRQFGRCGRMLYGSMPSEDAAAGGSQCSPPRTERRPQRCWRNRRKKRTRFHMGDIGASKRSPAMSWRRLAAAACHMCPGQGLGYTAGPCRIAVPRRDTDWYSSTKHELVHRYPRAAPGDVVIIDDHGFWRGSRRATDEYLAETGGEVAV